MNALANDQVRRLRQVLAGTPEIMFGRYTGETPERPAEGASLFEALNPGEARLPNELLSRAEMRDTPPHLLLTNYAMLEYLLLRPADMDLFEGPHGGHWRFVVLDEAHVYDGAKAEEVGMLLRRLKHKVFHKNGCGPLRGPATPGDRDERHGRRQPGGRHGVRSEAVRRARSSGVPATRPARTWFRPRGSRCRTARSGTPPASRPEDAAGLGRVRALLAGGPLPFTDLAARGGDLRDPAGGTGRARRRDQGRVRAHRYCPPATTCSPGPPRARSPACGRAAGRGRGGRRGRDGPHVALARREVCPDCSAAVFEFGCCKRCGAVYLTGVVEREATGEYFTSRIARGDRRSWLLLGDAPRRRRRRRRADRHGAGAVDEDDAAFEEAAEHRREGRHAVRQVRRAAPLATPRRVPPRPVRMPRRAPAGGPAAARPVRARRAAACRAGRAAPA